MADEYGYIINRPGYTYNYQKIFNKIINVIDNFNLTRYEELVHLGVNPFDLFLLETFLRENNIKKVLELGSGTTTKLLDVLGIERKTFALECMNFTDLKFDKIDLYESYEVVQKYIDNNKIDFILIDCEHSRSMGELIYNHILKYTNFKVPIFIHDWFDFEKETYQEQVFYYNHLFEYYDLDVMSDLPIKYINKLGVDINSECHVPRCSAILTPKKWKM